MTERFCKNDDGDCPCLDLLPRTPHCRLLPEAKTIIGPGSWYCYSGRQIMEQQATWNALKNCYPAEAIAAAVGGKIEE